MYSQGRSAWCTKAELNSPADSENIEGGPPCSAKIAHKRLRMEGCLDSHRPSHSSPGFPGIKPMLVRSWVVPKSPRQSGCSQCHLPLPGIPPFYVTQPQKAMKSRDGQLRVAAANEVERNRLLNVDIVRLPQRYRCTCCVLRRVSMREEGQGLLCQSRPQARSRSGFQVLKVVEVFLVCRYKNTRQDPEFLAHFYSTSTALLMGEPFESDE